MITDTDDGIMNMIVRKMNHSTTYFLVRESGDIEMGFEWGICELNGLMCEQTNEINCKNCNFPIIELVERMKKEGIK